MLYAIFFFFNDTATTEIYTLSLHDALPISLELLVEPPDLLLSPPTLGDVPVVEHDAPHGGIFQQVVGSSFQMAPRSEEHTSELQSRQYLVCRLLLEKKKTRKNEIYMMMTI